MKQLALGLAAPTQPREAQLRHYHVRSHQTVAEAKAGEAKAQRQEGAVLRVFGRYPKGERMTPSEVWWCLGGGGKYGSPLTSIRRAMTTMAKREPALLIHHPHDRRRSPLGGKESSWSLAPDTTLPPSAPTADSTSTD